jgi:hypothetical protein
MSETDTPTYTDRTIEEVTIKRLDKREVIMDTGWSAWVEESVQRWLAAKGVGARVGLETRKFSQIVGWLDLDTGTWIERKSDQDLEAEHQAWLVKWEQEKWDRLEASREDWTKREAALPDWIRARLTSFRETEEVPGSFDKEGWGYELVIAELAAMYDSNGMFDDDDIRDYARREGTSGNQHSMAKALVGAHRDGVNVAGTVSALSPITGKAGY